MLSLVLYTVIIAATWEPSTSNAQVITGGAGLCAGEADKTINLVAQEVVTLRSQITQAQLALVDIEAMEQCAARQMVWVSGYATADAGGCISVEEFRGPPGDPGPQGEAGEDATCP